MNTKTPAKIATGGSNRTTTARLMPFTAESGEPSTTALHIAHCAGVDAAFTATTATANKARVIFLKRRFISVIIEGSQLFPPNYLKWNKRKLSGNRINIKHKHTTMAGTTE